jgi:serine/threonine-protein kinase
VSEGITNIDGYDLINCIATGNVSQVWEVKQVASGQTFAMKLMLPECFSDPDHKAAMKHEASVGKSLDHPNLIKVHLAKYSKKHAYFIMELFRGVNLKAMIRNDLTGAQARVKKIMECATQALAHMHEKGWVHKDVKPENILVTKGSEVRVIDFSLAARAASALTKVLTSKKGRIIQGTRTYIAPELIRREPVTPAADIYSLGITLYEILTGRPPFIQSTADALLMAHIQDRVEPPTVLNPNVTPEADKLVLRMLAKKPKDRHTNMQEVFAELRSIQFFKQDPGEFARNRAEAADTKFKDSMGHRLDSRTDAGRSVDERAAAQDAAKQKAKKLERAKQLEAAAKQGKLGQAATAAPPPVPAYPAPMPGYAPPMPGYPPAYPMPGMPMPGMPMPGMPMPYPPQYPPPGGGVPQPQVPAAAPATPAAAAPAAAPASPEPPTPSRPVPPRRKTHPSRPREEDAHLPVMDELPDVV